MTEKEINQTSLSETLTAIKFVRSLFAVFSYSNIACQS